MSEVCSNDAVVRRGPLKVEPRLSQGRSKQRKRKVDLAYWEPSAAERVIQYPSPVIRENRDDTQQGGPSGGHHAEHRGDAREGDASSMEDASPTELNKNAHARDSVHDVERITA